MVIVAKQPSYLGKFDLGSSRLGMFAPRHWERLLESHSRLVTWMVGNLNVDRDATTGHRVPDYSLTHDIYGVFEDQGGSLIPLPAGYVPRGDAVFRCFDNVKHPDIIYLPEDRRYFKVGYVKPSYNVLVRDAENVTSFCFRTCDLHLTHYTE
jgi:hypothetical protein